MQKNKNIKLIIWDFDGVIADTEKLWLKNRQKLINQVFSLNWDFETTNKYLGGRSDKTKREVLDSLNMITDDKFWEDSVLMDKEILKKGFKLTEGIEDIFKLNQFEQCIATGGIKKKTAEKVRVVKIDKYFTPNKIFTVDMVEKGKPEPDLFLFAAESMGFKPEECVVIEDSLAGMRAGLAANMLTIAFIGCEMNNNPQNIKAIKKLGIKYIFDNMNDIKEFLLR